VGVVRDLIGVIDDLGLQARRLERVELLQRRPIVWRRVFSDALTHLPGEIQSSEGRIAFLQQIHYAQALLVVLEAAVVCHQLIQHALAGVAEGRVSQVVRQRHRLSQVFVQAQGAGNGAGDLRRLHGVRQPCPVVVALVIDEHLRLVLEPAERGRVDDAVAIALERQPESVLRFWMPSAAAVAAVHRVGSQRRLLQLLEIPAFHEPTIFGPPRSAQHGARCQRRRSRSTVRS